MTPSVSVIVAFYNQLDYLRLVLAGFERQSFESFEIIIADDGSDPRVVQQLEEIISGSSLRIKHVWHPDKGWRKNRILNKAVQLASSGYLIIIDGDCVPHGEFVNEHCINRRKNIALTGRRVNLSSKFTSKLTPEFIKSGKLDRNLVPLIVDGVLGKSFDVEKGFYFKSAFIRSYFNKKKRGLLGCNFSIHKEELLKINGFDERYEAPSIGEDSDIQFRYELFGGGIKSLNNIAVQYHLYHEIKPRPQENLDLFEKIKSEKQYFTPSGIEKG